MTKRIANANGVPMGNFIVCEALEEKNRTKDSKSRWKQVFVVGCPSISMMSSDTCTCTRR